MAKNCPKCGAQNDLINNFCFSCGNSLVTAAHEPRVKPAAENQFQANIIDDSGVSSEPIKNETHFAFSSFGEPKTAQEKLALGITPSPYNAFNAGNRSTFKKSKAAINIKYIYMASALLAAIIMGGGIYWSQKPKDDEPIITMADVRQVLEEKHKPRPTAATSLEDNQKIAKQVPELSPNAESKEINARPTVVAEQIKEDIKEDIQPNITKKTKVKKVKKVIKTTTFDKDINNAEVSKPNQSIPTEPAKLEAPLTYESKKENATASSVDKSAEEQSLKGVIDIIVKEVKKGAPSECTQAQRALNQCY